MNCICKQNTYWKGNLEDSALIGETEAGARTRMLNGLTLTVEPTGFTLTNSDGATLRQGTAKNVFEIYDSMPFPCDNLHIDAPGFNGTFESYEIAHGHGRVERTKVVKFAAFTETTESATAIGITRMAAGKTKAIYALYYDQRLSRREKAKEIADFVYPLLKPTERASISAVGINQDRANANYAGVVRIDSDAYKPKHEEARLLYGGAIESGQGTAEVFETAMKYETQGLFEQAEAAQATEGGGQE